MIDKSFELLNEDELLFNQKIQACKTIEELQELCKYQDVILENSETPQYKHINMPIEEFKKKYDLVDIRDLKGKYGF